MSTSGTECIVSRHVYAGILSNRTNQAVLCTIHYSSGINHHVEESVSVTIDSGGRACIPEREYQPSPGATFTCRKIVSRIDVQIDDQFFSLEQPFDGVICPVSEWKFDIYDDYIASINPNILTIINGSAPTSQ